MLTPQEGSEHAFAKASFGGYNMAMVDEFLDVLTADYTTLYKENATLKAKMKVLVDKVEEYRSTEEAMRKALLTAQKMADELVAGEAPEEDAEDTVDLGGGAKEKDGGLYAELLELSRSHGPEEAEEPTEPTRRIDFDHLQFGKDYEIK